MGGFYKNRGILLGGLSDLWRISGGLHTGDDGETKKKEGGNDE